MCKLMRFSYLSHIVFFTNGPHPVVLAIPAGPHHSHNCPQSPEQQFESNMTITAGITLWVLHTDCLTITLIMNSTDHELLWLTHWLHQLPHWSWTAMTHWLHQLSCWSWTAMTYPLTSSTPPLNVHCHDLPTDFIRGCRYIIIWTKFQASHLQSLHPEILSHFQSNRKESNTPWLGAYESMWSMRHSCMSWWFV